MVHFSAQGARVAGFILDNFSNSLRRGQIVVLEKMRNRLPTRSSELEGSYRGLSAPSMSRWMGPPTCSLDLLVIDVIEMGQEVPGPSRLTNIQNSNFKPPSLLNFMTAKSGGGLGSASATVTSNCSSSSSSAGGVKPK